MDKLVEGRVFVVWGVVGVAVTVEEAKVGFVGDEVVVDEAGVVVPG